MQDQTNLQLQDFTEVHIQFAQFKWEKKKISLFTMSDVRSEKMLSGSSKALNHK